MKKIILLIFSIVLCILIYNKNNIKIFNNNNVTSYVKDNVVVEISDGLTPVIYDENKKNWRIIKKDEEWFDYTKQKWANAVILKDKNNNKEGKMLDIEKDVYAMYVYIPRYSYTIKEPYGRSIDGNKLSTLYPGAIDIKFINNNVKENGNASYTGNKAKEFRTHPAFTFGDKELNGIWVGKFEMTGSEKNPTILPNNKSLTNLNISSLYNTVRRFNNYGLDQSINDFHMIKNSEWGAVAYLTQSIYGKYGNKDYSYLNKEVYQNKSLDCITGMSSGTPSTINDYTEFTYDIVEMKEIEKKIKKESNKEIEYKIIDNNSFVVEDNVLKSIKKEDGTTSNIRIKFSLEEKGNIDFDWAASTPNVEIEKFDYIIKKDNEVIIDTISDKLSIGGIRRGIIEGKLQYEHRMHELEKGDYEIEFIYTNVFLDYDNVPDSLNRGFVKNISITIGSKYETVKEKTQRNGVGASTTGNIYGIYDMSGGAVEYVMGLYINEEFGSTDQINYSGFTNKNKPDEKYYDIYTSSDMNNACDNQKCYGIGYGETSWWYEDIATSYAFPNKDFPWVFRGDAALDLEGAGIFMNYGKEGMELSNFSSRAVLVIDK